MPKAAVPKVAFATEVPASKFTPSSASKAAIPPPAPRPVPQPVVQKPPENVVFSKKTGTGGGNGKPAPRPEPPKPERIINTHEDSKSITTQAEAKLCAKKWLNENKQAMGNNKWVDKNHIYQIDDAKHHGNMVEIEVFRNKGKNPPHECVLDCFGKKIKPAKKGRTYNGK